MMSLIPRPQSRRRVDVASAALLLIGLVSGWFCYQLVTDHGANPLIMVPAIVAATVGASHITKRQAPR